MSAIPEVSYVVTQYNKAGFLPLVVAALAAEGGDFAREVIVVDDGSTDGSVEHLRHLENRLPGPLRLITQENGGASQATNVGVMAARAPWVRLLDGDDQVTPTSTARLLVAARRAGVELAYGDLETIDPETPPTPEPAAAELYEVLSAEAGLARFIRNSGVNSSAILVSKALYLKAGGCDERLVSPDHMLILRLFANAPGLHLRAPVARVPKTAPDRLSNQIRRSRYESVLALHFLLSEYPDLPHRSVTQAYRRATSRAYNYSRAFGRGGLTNPHLWRYLRGKLMLPADPATAILACLSAFTEDGGVERPREWQPGALRRGMARARIG
jgi:glycosyltransferase involved in cell wall biosynthesis